MIYSHIDGDQLGRQYKEHLSNFTTWDVREHAQEWLVFPENIGEHLSIDETSLSNGELYTLVTNKAGKGRKGTIVAIVSGTESEKVIEALERMPEELPSKVKEVTLDMADSMRRIVRRCFPNAIRVIDRFHVQKLAYLYYVRSTSMTPFRKCALPIVGMLSTKKQMLSKKPNYPEKNTSHRRLKTEIQKNNSLPVADIFCSNLQRNGQRNKNLEPNCFLNFILTLKKHIL